MFILFYQPEFLKGDWRDFTPPNSEIICGQNVGKKVVCGMILFFEKKIIPQTTFVPTFWPHIISELGGVI